MLQVLHSLPETVISKNKIWTLLLFSMDLEPNAKVHQSMHLIILKLSSLNLFNFKI